MPLGINLRRCLEKSDFYLFKLLHLHQSFRFRGKTYSYFYHFYNRTDQNERCVEIPIVSAFLKQFKNKQILEVGNVLSHYFPVQHEIVDKYESAPGVINQDIIDFQPKQKYDLIVSISTLEHIGLDEKPRQKNKAYLALQHLVSLLAPQGRLLITFPLGYNSVLDKMLINEQSNRFRIYYLKRISAQNHWQQVNLAQIKSTPSNQNYTRRKPTYNSPFPFANAVAIISYQK